MCIRDRSENAEYDAAKEAQGLLEMKISQLKSTIGDAKIIDTSTAEVAAVSIIFFSVCILGKQTLVNPVPNVAALEVRVFVDRFPPVSYTHLDVYQRQTP